MADTIILDRLIKSARINSSKLFVWGEPVTTQDVKDFLSTGKHGTEIPYGNNHNMIPDVKDKDYHISRVAYFVQHPEEITDIDVDNQCIGMHITSRAIVTDGWHRLMAAYILGLETIEVNYGGRVDVLEYLQGLRNEEDLED